jgi:hypothetical protein
MAPTPEVNSADHSYIDGQLTTPLPVDNINIQSAAKEKSGSEDSSEDEELAIETLAKSIRKYRDDVATLYDSSIRDAVNSKIYNLQSGWWTKRLDALTKGIEVFETEINSGAAGNATVDILYSNNDEDECDQYIPGLDRLRSAHSMYWAFDPMTNAKAFALSTNHNLSGGKRIIFRMCMERTSVATTICSCPRRNSFATSHNTSIGWLAQLSSH